MEKFPDCGIIFHYQKSHTCLLPELRVNARRTPVLTNSRIAATRTRDAQSAGCDPVLGPPTKSSHRIDLKTEAVLRKLHSIHLGATLVPGCRLKHDLRGVTARINAAIPAPIIYDHDDSIQNNSFKIRGHFRSP